jgi:hypothetical protein
MTRVVTPDSSPRFSLDITSHSESGVTSDSNPKRGHKKKRKGGRKFTKKRSHSKKHKSKKNKFTKKNISIYLFKE